MTYSDFKKINDSSKQFFDILGRITDVNLKNNTCSLIFDDNITRGLDIGSIVDDIVNNEMGAVSNPRSIKDWKGFSR